MDQNVPVPQQVILVHPNQADVPVRQLDGGNPWIKSLTYECRDQVSLRVPSSWVKAIQLYEDRFIELCPVFLRGNNFDVPRIVPWDRSHQRLPVNGGIKRPSIRERDCRRELFLKPCPGEPPLRRGGRHRIRLHRDPREGDLRGKRVGGDPDKGPPVDPLLRGSEDRIQGLRHQAAPLNSNFILTFSR